MMRALLLLVLTGCATAVERDAGVGTFVFPHPADYEVGPSHGPDAQARGPGVCLSCHGVTPTAPTCTSCHADFPHRVGFLGNHGREADDSCVTCHASDQAPSCTSCHTTFPHAPDWLSSHGAAVLARADAQASCGPCHGPQLLGTATAPACRTCHDYPHPADYRHQGADPATCTACHGEDLSGGAAGVACSRCHPSFPHVEGWSASHIATADKIGERVCLACHGRGDGPELVAATCAGTCHGGDR